MVRRRKERAQACATRILAGGDAHLVMGASDHTHPIRFRVTINGAPPGADHGFDVDADGWGRASDERLYQLVRQAGPVGEHTFEIEFFGAGVRGYGFTFG